MKNVNNKCLTKLTDVRISVMRCMQPKVSIEVQLEVDASVAGGVKSNLDYYIEIYSVLRIGGNYV